MTIPSQRRYVAYYAQLLFLARLAVLRRDAPVAWPLTPPASLGVMQVYKSVPLLLKAVTLRQASTLTNSGTSCTLTLLESRGHALCSTVLYSDHCSLVIVQLHLPWLIVAL